jgi:hypothetical protein
MEAVALFFAEAAPAAAAAEVATVAAPAVAAPSLFTASNLSLAGGAFSAVSSILQGHAQSTAYRLQASQAELQGRQNALNYNRQAYQLLERQQRLASTIRARAVAGGVDPLSGSPLTVEQSNAYRAGNEMQILSENAQLAMSGGLATSQSLQSASAQTYGLFSGIGSGLLAGAKYRETQTPKQPQTIK